MWARDKEEPEKMLPQSGRDFSAWENGSFSGAMKCSGSRRRRRRGEGGNGGNGDGRGGGRRHFF